MKKKFKSFSLSMTKERVVLIGKIVLSLLDWRLMGARRQGGEDRVCL